MGKEMEKEGNMMIMEDWNLKDNLKIIKDLGKE